MRFPRPAAVIWLLVATACSSGGPASNLTVAETGDSRPIADGGDNAALAAAGSVPGGNEATADAERASSGDTRDPQSTSEIVRNVTATLRVNLRQTGITLDGKPVTDLRVSSLCEGTIVAGPTSATFKWAEIGNIAAELHGRTQMLQLSAGSAGAHVLTMPRGQAGDNIVSNIGLLEASCQHGG